MRDKRLSKFACTALIAVFSILQLSPASSPEANAAEQVSYRLKWLFNMSVAGDIYADVHRYFQKQGLTVTIKEGGPERDAIRELELGRAQFGVASADQVIRALSKGADVVVIAQLFQINPLQWMYRPDYLEIQNLGDLKGKTLGVTFGGNDEHILRTLLAKAGLAENDVTLFSVRYDYTPFFQKKVNFWPVYRNSQAVFLGGKLREAGESYAFFNPVDYGVQFVANSVVTSRQLLEKKPDTVNRFTVALLRGWQAAMDPANSDKTIRAVQNYDKDSSLSTLVEQLEITRSLVHPLPAVPVGTIDVPAWKQTEQILLDQKQIPAAVGVEKHLISVPKY
ncbi:MAG: nitrate ABC transporter substrate-binding protein [Deltaproteobacteria bacterium SG8_13]|nr:MAG: nitrate ABC transporter substrate-binding protein [Deltaproteobacteria bacterium SG8_13]